MLQYVSRDATLYSRSFVKTIVVELLSRWFWVDHCTRWTVWCWRCGRLECVNRSLYLPKCDSAMLSQYAEKKSQVGLWSKELSAFQEAALVTMWGADQIILYSPLISGLSLVTPEIHPCHMCCLQGSHCNFVFTGYWLLIRENANARNLTL